MAELQTYLDQLKGKFRKEEREPIIAEIANLGEAAIPSIIDAIRKNERVFDLTEALVQIGQASTLPLLDLFFEDFDRQTFVDAVIDEALKNLRDERVIEPLLRVFEVGDTEHAPRAVRILAQVNDERVVPKMVQLLKDTNTPEGIKGSAIALLGRLNAVEWSELIAPYLNNENLHTATVFALYSLGDKRSIQPLKTMLLDKKVEYACAILAYLLGEYPNHEFVPILLEMLKNFFETPQFFSKEYSTISDMTINGLGKLKDDMAVDLLMRIVHRGEAGHDTAVQAVAEIGTDYAVEQLINQLAQGFEYWDEYGTGHKQVADALASFGEKIVPRLMKIVADKTDDIHRRRVASGILLRIDKNYIDYLSNI